MAARIDALEGLPQVGDLCQVTFYNFFIEDDGLDVETVLAIFLGRDEKMKYFRQDMFWSMQHSTTQLRRTRFIVHSDMIVTRFKECL